MRPIRVSSNSSSRYKTRIGNAMATGGRMSCDKNQNEMSLFRQGPNRYKYRARPYAANDPIKVAKAAALSEMVTVLDACFTKRLRALDGRVIVSGDSPRDSHPFQFGSNWSQGIRSPS